MYHSWFTHSPAEGHFDCFQVLTIMSEAATNIYGRILWGHKFSTHVGNYQRVWLLDHMVRLCFTFWQTIKLFSRPAVPFHSPTNNVWGFQTFYILAKYLLFSIFTYYYNILVCMKWILIVVLIFTSLMIKDAEHLFLCLFAICVSSLEKCLFRFLPIF